MKLKFMTHEDSDKVFAFVSFLREALDAYDAVRQFREGAAEIKIPWPAGLKAELPVGFGPDLCRWEWEVISAKGKLLSNALPYRALPFSFELPENDPRCETALFFEKLSLGNSKGYRLVRYAWWWDSYPADFRARLERWADDLKGLLRAIPFESDDALA